MTSRDRRSFKRNGDRLFAYQIGPSPVEFTDHRPERDRLRSDAGGFGAAETPVELFECVRDATQVQSELVSDVAEFASLATSLPETLSAGEVPPYVDRRRELLVALEVVDGWLEAAGRADWSHLEDDVRESFEAFYDGSLGLQETLRVLIDRIDRVATALGRCHVCFDVAETDADACRTCDADRLDLEAWQDEDGKVAFEELFEAVNESLREAVAATEGVADRTTTFAETLLETDS